MTAGGRGNGQNLDWTLLESEIIVGEHLLL